MKFFHLSDLHIGKQLHNYNLKEDQKAILTQILTIAGEEAPDAVLISGDIYDKSVPSAEAVTIFDDFLTGLTQLPHRPEIMIIAGNHDSGERISYAKSILGRHHVHISGLPPKSEEEYLKKITIQDEYGDVNFYLLPFTKPAMVHRLFEGTELTAAAAVQGILERECVDLSRRNVLLAHQFFAGSGNETPILSDSETHLVGGIDLVPTATIAAFDYCALGHIHTPQKVGASHIRYCGTPLKYSVSEASQEKSLTIVTLREKGTEPEVTLRPLCPLRDLRVLHGTAEEVISDATEQNRNDYVSVTITDEDTSQAIARIRDVYPHVLELRVDNARTRSVLSAETDETEIMDPYTVFSKFFKELQGREMSESERDVMTHVINQATDWRSVE